MKHLKLYEDIETEIQLGDYIVCKDELFEYPTKNNDKDFVDFISNNIGRFVEINDGDRYAHQYKYLVQYQNVPKNLSDYFDLYKGYNSLRAFSRSEIIRKATPEEIEELKIKNDAFKYNL